MTTTDWIFVAAALAGGVLVGVLASRLVSTIVGAPSRPEPVRNAAGALASLALWAGIVTGLVIAMGVASPGALDQLPKDVIAYIPRVVSAAIVVIVANVLSSFAQAAIGPALGRMTSTVQRQVLSTVRMTILTLAVLLAVRQLGFDTTVINLGVAAIFFGISGALMLLVALGGRGVATEVASTRVIRRLINSGDRIQLESLSGTVAAVHPTSVEVVNDETGEIVLVPSSRFVNGTFSIERVSQTQVG